MLNPLPVALTGDQEILARAEALRPQAEALSGEIERLRRLPPAWLDKLHEARLFRMLLPRSVGGLETDPMTFMQVIESIAQGDGSTAWCLSQGGGCAMAAAYLDPPVAAKIFGDPRAVLAWGPGPKAKVREVEGGYRVTGVWAFASGARHATWLGAHGPIWRSDGTPVIDEDGVQAERTMLVPASEPVLTDIWDTVGLRGTASDQFSLDDHYVRADHSMTRNFERECREPGPVYRLAALQFYEMGFASVGMGIARASLGVFMDLARTKVQRGLKIPLRDNAAVQTNFAQAEAGLRSARAFLHQTVADTWKHVCQPGAKLTVEQRILIRMASTHAIHQAREAVDFAYNTIGTSAVFASHPLERRFRDMHTVTQHLQGRMGHFETVGAWMLGAEADLTFV
ncbi:MAG: acyl-CoA dehydrogenase family protein [Burkholderiales bacterium]